MKQLFSGRIDMGILFTIVRRDLMLALMLLATSLMIVNRAVALRNAENQGVRDLLSLAAQQSASLDYDADQMQSLLHSDAAWQTHATLLESVKVHVNQLSLTVAKLQAERSEASTWQQKGIDRVVPLLRELAENTTAAINHINKNQGRPVSGYYSEYLDENAETAHDLNRIISATIEYGHLRNKLEKLEEQIQPST
jgi:hypothetical protein